MSGMVYHIARPVTLWALHFIAVYALISAACAPRGLIETDVMRAAAALTTAAVAVLALAWLLQSRRALARRDAAASDRPLAVASVWTVGISLMAIIANLWPVAFLATCTG